jgi:hypothetical protein
MPADTRRNFLLGTGLFGTGELLAQGRPDPRLSARAAHSLRLRQSAALTESFRTPASLATNGDEALYPTLFANFTKGLSHSQLGEVDPTQYQALLYALSTQQHSDFEKIPIGFGRKLVNCESAFTYDLEGGDSQTFTMPVPPAFNSAQVAAEMVELYWQAALRDTPFSQFPTSPVAQAAAAELTALSGYQGPRDSNNRVTADNLFRGTAPGCLTGPYLSQYLLQTVYFGSTPREQTYRTGMPGVDYMTVYSEWLELQSGLPPYRTEVFDPTFRYIRTGRDLAQFVHYDYTYQAFLQAALIILNQYPEQVLNFNTYQLNHTNPYKTSRIQTGFTTFGSAHALDWVARVANLALKPACFQKWAVHRRVRPEAFAGCVYNTVNGAAKYPVHADLLNSKALAANIAAIGGALLPQAYVEGCPLHPSYPAGHAVIAGACATVLKALFEETDLVSAVVTPSDDGLSLLPDSAAALTIGGELNKLAFNIPMARNWAGIHYRSDASAGLLLGEAVAIAFLQDNVNTFTETFAGFQFTKFDGTAVSIAPE